MKKNTVDTLSAELSDVKKTLNTAVSRIDSIEDRHAELYECDTGLSLHNKSSDISLLVFRLEIIRASIQTSLEILTNSHRSGIISLSDITTDRDLLVACLDILGMEADL